MSIDVISREWINFGVFDPKGREIGILLRISLDTDGQYIAYAHQTRSGALFGGIQPRKWFDTLEEAKSYCAERSASSAKRAKKQFGPK